MELNQREGLLENFGRLYHVSTDQFHNGTPCWIWDGATKTKSRYGSFGFGKRSFSVPAHCAAWRLLRGEVPAGLQLDHLCRRRNCVNPEHLEPVTCGENIRRGDAPKLAGTWQRARTHCPQGHEYSIENTYRHPGTNYRSCRICRESRERAKLKRRTTKTHCAKGHEFTPQTTYIEKHGWRSCQICRDIRNGKHTLT
jgi:hypothetical protein